METGIGAKLVLHSIVLGPTRYAIVIDGETFMHSENDDDGLTMAIAVAKLNLLRNIRPN